MAQATVGVLQYQYLLTVHIIESFPISRCLRKRAKLLLVPLYQAIVFFLPVTISSSRRIVLVKAISGSLLLIPLIRSFFLLKNAEGAGELGLSYFWINSTLCFGKFVNAVLWRSWYSSCCTSRRRFTTSSWTSQWFVPAGIFKQRWSELLKEGIPSLQVQASASSFQGPFFMDHELHF